MVPSVNQYVLANRGGALGILSILTNGNLGISGTLVTYATFDGIEVPI